MEEFLDIVDGNGEPTGEIVERVTAHEKGIRHRTSHVWIFRKKDGKVQVLLQRRSDNKDSYPGCYDISSAGHIPAGGEFVLSAIRELKEELGCNVKESDLQYCGQRTIQFQQEFYGKQFLDCQISNIYMLWLDKDEAEFTLQEEEVSEVRWFDFQECLELVRENKIPHCIIMEELEMLEKHVSENF